MPEHPVDRRMLSEARRALLDRALLVEDRSLPGAFLRFPERKDADPVEVLCAIDPFGCLAYLSAMEFHGLTNRLPRILYFALPDAQSWHRLAIERMRRDLGELNSIFTENELPPLRNTKVAKLGGMVVEAIRSKSFGGWRYARNETMRVTTTGRTFLHMLQRPDLCGGIHHVIEVYVEHAKSHLALIASEFTQHGTTIDRMRAGYILEERCGLKDHRVEMWALEASRGGSRKLDPQKEYASQFSEKWCLSINV
jgi:predicted transcriptional regulator of viral defense system